MPDSISVLSHTCPFSVEKLCRSAKYTHSKLKKRNRFMFILIILRSSLLRYAQEPAREKCIPILFLFFLKNIK